MKFRELNSTKFILSAESIDMMSEQISLTLAEHKTDHKDILRLRLSAEEVLGLWLRELGEGAECLLTSGNSFGRRFLIISCVGKPVDPTEYLDEEYGYISRKSSIMTAMGMVPEYHYENGCNKLEINLPPKQKNPLVGIFATIALAIAVGLMLKLAFPVAGRTLDYYIMTPVFDAIMRAIRMIAGPLVFLSVLAGILNIGDKDSFSKIGKGLLIRFVGGVFAFGVAMVIPLTIAFKLDGGSASISGGELFSQILGMILDIIPENIIDPFQTGNALQIIFMAIMFGIASLLLGDSVSRLNKIICQLVTVIQMVMSIVAKILPAVIFLCLVKMIIASEASEMVIIVAPFATIVVFNISLALIMNVITVIRTGISMGELLKLQLPSYLTALTTASSAAAYGLTIECCNKLKVDRKLINFGVPLGQVVFMPAAATELFVMSFYMLSKYGMPITLVSVITIWFSGSILAIAEPPVPGGMVAIISVIFLQLGLPEEAIALATTVLLFTDYFSTASNIVCLEDALRCTTYDMGMMKENENE